MRDLSRSKYGDLLKDEDFRRWYENVSRGSLVTSQEWFRRMGFVSKEFKVTPQDIAKMNPKQASNFLLDVITSLEKQKKSGNYIANIIKPLKSWMLWNDIEISKKIKIPRSQPTKVENERPPTPDELRQILAAADLRGKVACALVAFGGCRIEVLGNYSGDDGLKIGDIPEMKVSSGAMKVEFEKVPLEIRVRKSLNKAKHQYFTFLSAEGCEYLQQYMEWRLRLGEGLSPEVPVITFHERKGKFVKRSDVGVKHITSINMGDIIRKPIRRAGFGWRPYVLRRYFDVRMMMAESDGLIIRDWRQFFMGHKGDIEHTYTVNKGLQQDAIEKMRDAYRKAAERYLATAKNRETSDKYILATMNRKFLMGAHWTEEEIEALGDLGEIEDSKLQELLDRKTGQMLALNRNRQKVVPLSEVKGWIGQGWEYTAQLPDGDAIIRLPSVRS